MEMRMNSFTNSMSKKSNTELENIIADKDNYTDEAVQAVIWELENRNIIEKGKILHEIAPIESEVVLKEELSTEKGKESPFEGLLLPTLYSKRSIQGFTIFFSTLFGAILLMRNLKEMNKPKVRIQVLVFGVSYTIISVLLLNYLPKTFFITLLFNLIGYAILVEYFWNKNLGKDLEYKKKKIVKPLLISLLILGFLVFLQLSQLDV
ncbi:hypothetical protein [uncultured Polaribacter sp.]|uniref:hypothetical protein n=1 Tax=uncultured Polaribacter sp. TaxID=174711 RepID=UPI002602CBA9|nr:hypothetical protein [uncultured Polaribacter sp.]